MAVTTPEAWVTPRTPAATDADKDGIRSVVFDYFEGWYDHHAERVSRALYPGLAKRSFAQDPDRTPALETIGADQMTAWTAMYPGIERAGARRMTDIRIDDISGGIATARVYSERYVEYLHIVLMPDGWKIANTLWRYADGHGPGG